MMFKSDKAHMPSANEALPGRAQRMVISGRHAVLGTNMLPPYPAGTELALVGLGCFWGAERKFWTLPGVHSTAVGYAAGFTPNPTYEEVCTGLTGHNEVVQVVFDPQQISYVQLLKVFWESHNPTQGMRQGNDVGTQYRSGIYVHNDVQRQLAEQTRAQYASLLARQGYGAVTTEIVDAPEFYFAEEYHQQYLHKSPSGYCGIGGCGVTLKIPELPADEKM